MKSIITTVSVFLALILSVPCVAGDFFTHQKQEEERLKREGKWVEKKQPVQQPPRIIIVPVIREKKKVQYAINPKTGDVYPIIGQ